MSERPTTEALRQAAMTLREAGVDDPMRDARRLLAHVLGIPAARLVVDMPQVLEAGLQGRFDEAVGRRAAREPLSHITGERLFYGRSFQVTADVLDPRPETETLVIEALKEPFGSVLDMGSGSGCILLTLLAETPSARGVGSDLSEAALRVARGNARALGLEPRADFVAADWYEGLEAGARFDLIVSNPPYITDDEMAELSPEVLHEPRMALTPGGDGLSPYVRIAEGAARHLCPGGRLIVEIGYRQGPAVARIFRARGLEEVAVHADLDGRDRVVSARSTRQTRGAD